MTKLFFLASAIAVSAMMGSCNVRAQERAQEIVQQPTLQDNRQANPNAPVQTLPGQSQRDATGSAADSAQAYQARRPANQGQQQGMPLKQAIVQKMIQSNKAEIELAQLAQQKTDNQEVKQLTQMVIQDHQALTDELQKFSNQQLQGQSASKQGQNQTRTPQQPGQSPGQAQPNQGQPRSQGQMTYVPQEIQQIAAQACENNLQMTKEMLGNYQGQDFTMAFLGQQAVMHTMTLAELKAIQSAGPQELQPIIENAITKIEKHLEQTKQLAKKLEDDRRAS